MIARPRELKRIESIFSRSPICAILGPRQVGKSTLARSLNPDHFFDLEDPRDASRLGNPLLALEGLSGTIVIDEVQRMPELFPILRVLADKKEGPPRRFVLLGSSRPEIVRGASESLAGRIGFLDLGGFRLDDPDIAPLERLWLRGAFPASYIAESEAASWGWRSDFARSFWERDLPALGLSLPPGELRRFWTLLSHYHGQTINYSEIGRILGTSDMTIRRWLSILEGTMILRLLQPWFENAGKRIVKSPKLYFLDSGFFHFFQGIADLPDLQSHPRLGASWEGFALEEIRKALESDGHDQYFWRTHGGAELDLLYSRNGKPQGCEFKYADAPRLHPSMTIAKRDLGLARLSVIVPAGPRYYLAEDIEVVKLTDYIHDVTEGERKTRG